MLSALCTSEGGVESIGRPETKSRVKSGSNYCTVRRSTCSEEGKGRARVDVSHVGEILDGAGQHKAL